MKKAMPAGRQGFTLIELLVGIGMSAIIFVVVGSLLVSILTTNSKGRRQEAFEQVKNDVLGELSNAVRWADEVSLSGGQLVVDEVVYEETTGRIVKNGQPLTPAGVRVENFEVRQLSAATDLASVRITADLEDANLAAARDRLTIVVSQRRTTVGGGL